MTRLTQAERLTRMETLLETHFATTEAALQRNGDFAKQVGEKLEEMDERWSARFDAIEAAQNDDIARLAELENKGKGAFAVASLVFTSIGAFVVASWDTIKNVFH